MATWSTAWWANGATISTPGSYAEGQPRLRPRLGRQQGAALINLSALRAVREARGGRLGFNAKVIIEMGEEIGSPDLAKVCASLRDELAADVFVGSDGPRLSAERPTIFLGCRGGLRIHLDVELRDGGHHSGNWGGVLANPATILANAISSLVDGQGHLRLDEMKPPRLSNQIRSMLADVKVEPMADEPALSPNWGEDGLSPAERLYAWNTLEVLAISSGNIEKPANAIPGRANAVLQLRFVVGTPDRQGRACNSAALRQKRPLDGQGPRDAELCRIAHRSRQSLDQMGGELDPADHRQGARGAAEFRRLAAQRVFSDVLGLPTIWVPHSYPGCSQHAPDEHILLSVTEEALSLMAGLFWDLGEMKRPL